MINQRMKSKAVLNFFAGILFLSFTFGLNSVHTYAKETTTYVSGTLYKFGEDSHYELLSENEYETIGSETKYGYFSITADMTVSGKMNGVTAYDVKNGNISFSYVIKNSLARGGEYTWHLAEDKTKIVDDISLDKDILSGAVIVQSSFDGIKWITDYTARDVLGEDSAYDSNIYMTSDIQLVNGCYYRVIVVHKEAIKLEDGAFLKRAKYDCAKYAEVYTFYARNGSEKRSKNTSPEGSPKKLFIDKSIVMNTGKDTGFDLSKAKALDKDDPHFGWSLGTFTVNGYTSETTEKNGNIVFLKTVGDEVTLWFTLTQDITALNNDPKLAISDDNNGYDKEYQIDKTDFKHGTLIVKYTDDAGNVHDPVIYTDFLEANTRTGANTKIVLYEEGEYEVALDYEINKSIVQAWSYEIVPEYTNYKTAFKFSIRNGNTMAFPKDLKTGSELKDGQITANGFSVDLAKSKYLSINVVRETVNVNSDGTISLDVRVNTVGKDNGEYSQEGKYTIEVSNEYTGGKPTEKVIYVGTNKYLRALTNNITVEKLNEKILAGFTVEEDGSLTAPPEPIVEEPVIEEPEEESEEKEAVSDLEQETEKSEEKSIVTTPAVEEKNTTASSSLSSSEDEAPVVDSDETIETSGDEKAKSNVGRIIVPIAVVLGFVVVAALYFQKKKQQIGGE